MCIRDRYYTPPYLMAMQHSLPAAVNRVESCLASDAATPAGKDLWDHCSVESIAADDRSRSTFERLAREGYLDLMRNTVRRRSSATESVQPPALP